MQKWLSDIDDVEAISKGIFGVLEAGIEDGLGPDAVGYLLRDQRRFFEALEGVRQRLEDVRRIEAIHNRWMPMEERVSAEG